MRKRKIVLIHASPAAISPIAQYYAEAAPELDLTNQLDDGLLRLFAAGETWAAERRLGEMINVGRFTYGAELALLTCSAVPEKMLQSLRREARVPIVKIDHALARSAVRAGRKIGVVVTFPATWLTTHELLTTAAAEAEATVELLPEVVPDAYQALLSGDHEKHDELLKSAVGRLDEQGADVVVLAQVSMARIVPQLDSRIRAKTLTSLDTSLQAVRDALSPIGSVP